jgi:uncharacterized protein (DUF2236 family)
LTVRSEAGYASLVSHPIPTAGPAALGFRPDDAIWRVNRELALLIGAGRALLLQIAHPLIAAGVREHSDFERDPFGRLTRTLEPMYALVFGTPAAGAHATAGMRRAHAPVRGVLREAVGAYPAGTAYDARDPVLRLWVHATLTDTGLLVYRRFVGELAPAVAARYYEDSRELARRVDVPEALVPPTLEVFADYMAGQVAGDALAVGPATRQLARSIFRPRAAPALRVIGPIVELVTAGLLPEPVRRMYGYRWSPARERALSAAAVAVRRLLPLLPPLLRHAPQARRAARARALAAR